MSNALHDLAELGHRVSDHIKVLADLVDKELKKQEPTDKKAAKKAAQTVIRVAADQAIKKL